MTGIVRRFSRRRNMSSSRIHSFYIITGTEFKGKHILEQDELFCCAIISSGLKEKLFYVTKTKKCRKKSFSFFLPWEFQTPISSSEAPGSSLLLGEPGLLISLSKNWLSQLIWPRAWEAYNGSERREAMKAIKAALPQDCRQQWERSFIHSPFTRLPFQKLFASHGQSEPHRRRVWI